MATIPVLDGVRGIAILLVLAQHLNLTGFGWSGVDLFFVLSGYLITGVLDDGKNDPHRARTFYTRRALRIFPLYYVTLALISIGPIATALGIGLPPHALRWYWSYLTNWYLAFAMPHQSGENLAYFWSLAVEEQFYLVWPLIVWHASRRTAVYVAVGAIIGAFLLRVALVGPGVSAFTIYALTPCRVDALAVGALIALLSREPAGLAGVRRRLGPLAIVASGAFAALAIWRRTLDSNDLFMMTIGFTAIAWMYGGLLVAALVWTPRVLTWEPLRWIGTRSYGLYVLHPLVIRAVTLHSGIANRPVTFVIVSAATSVAVAAVSYAGFERPFLRLKDRLAPRTPAYANRPTGAECTGMPSGWIGDSR